MIAKGAAALALAVLLPAARLLPRFDGRGSGW